MSGLVNGLIPGENKVKYDLGIVFLRCSVVAHGDYRVQSEYSVV